MYNVKVLPKFHFKEFDTNYCELHGALMRQSSKYSSREMVELMTATMAKLYDPTTMGCLYIPYWEEISDEDGRTLRNILKIDDSGLPTSQSREYDLLQYLSMCLQHLDKAYAEFVDNWCKTQELRCAHGDDEKDF